MKLDCEVVQDLLPLYHDEVCSKKSRNLVDEHLSECEKCRTYLRNLDAELELGDTVETVKPLASVHRRLNRMRVAAFSVGLALAIVLCFGAWWGLTQYSFIPLTPDEFTAVAMQHPNGDVEVAYTAQYYGASSQVFVSDENAIYQILTRAILTEKREMDSAERILSGKYTGGSATFSPDNPEDISFLTGTEAGPIDAYYIGKPGSKDAVLIWKRGMELPLVP